MPKKRQRSRRLRSATTILLSCIFLLWSCANNANEETEYPAEPIDEPTEPNPEPIAPPPACDDEPEVMTTADGVSFVRTPDACFTSLPNWNYEPQYIELDGLRQAYYEAGPTDGPVVLLLHGQPSWSYLYRKMIPVLAEAGYRAIAMDHLGMGRSDKPTQITSYSFVGHNDRLLRFMDALELRDITVFMQDWGSVLGLRTAGLYPDYFARVAIGNGNIRVIPAGEPPYPPVENPDISEDIPSYLTMVPEQQFPFYNGCEKLIPSSDNFPRWMNYAMKSTNFHPAEILEAATWFDLPANEEAAYDSPFPQRIYMAGVRVFPSLINELAGTTEEAWEGLTTFTKPFITIWGGNDAGGLGGCEKQDNLICNIPGAAGQAHTRLPEASHFLQDDQGAELARRVIAFIEEDPSVQADHEADCNPETDAKQP